MVKGLFMALLLLVAGTLYADALTRADAAVATILFDYDGAEEFASYRVNEEGFVDIVFAHNMPDRVYSVLLNRLQQHPDIHGVLAGRGGPFCQIDSWRADTTALEVD